MMELHERAPEFFRILVAMIILATTAAALRVYVRIKIVRSFGKDDYLMVAALLCFIVFTACALGGIRYGTGQHMSELTAENSMKALRYWWLCYAAYASTMILAKTSIGFFLLRVTIEQAHIWIIYAAMALTAITGTVFFFVTLLQCSPVSFFWTKAVDGTGSCLDMDVIIALTYFYSAVSALCDFTLGLLPVVMLWNLNMSRSTKIAVAPILGMGCIASAGVLVRTAYVEDFRDPDFLYSTVDIAIWSDIEEGLAITAGSLACLRPLFRTFRAALGTGDSSGNENNNNNNNNNNRHRQWPASFPSSQQPSIGSAGRMRKGSLGRPWSELLEETRVTQQTVDAEERGVLSVVVAGKDGGGVFEMVGGGKEVGVVVGVESVSSRGTLR